MYNNGKISLFLIAETFRIAHLLSIFETASDSLAQFECALRLLRIGCLEEDLQSTKFAHYLSFARLFSAIEHYLFLFII